MLNQVIDVDRLVDEQTLGWFNLSLLIWSFLAMFADGYDIAVLSFAVKDLRLLWHTTQTALGAASTMSLIGILVGSPLMGYVGDRFGRKRAILLGTAIYGVASLGIVWANGLTALIVLRFVTGIGLGGLMPNTIALNSELAPARLRATLVVLMFVGITVGSSAPGLTAAWLVPHYSWRVLFLLGGLVPLLVGVGLIFALPESVKFLAMCRDRPRELLALARRMRPDLALSDDTRFTLAQSGTSSAVGLKELYSPALARITPFLWVCFAMALMSNFFLNSWLPAVFAGSGLTDRQADIAATFYHVGGAVGGVCMAMLLDRFGFVITTVLFAAAVPAIAAIGFTSMSYGVLSVLAGVGGLCVLGAQFGNNASAGLIYPTAIRSKGVGWALGIGRFGAILGPLIGGRLLDMHIQTRQLFIAAALPMLIGAIAACVVLKMCYARLHTLRLSEIGGTP